MTSVGYNGSAPATVAEVLETRGEQVAQQWADLPLFRDVHTTGRDVAVGAARRLIEVLTEVARDGRPDDTSAPGFDRIRPHLAQMVTARSRAGATLGQITAEVTQLKAPLIGIVQQAGGDDGAAPLVAVELLGIDLGDITTRTTLADALERALRKLGVAVVGAV